MWGIAIAVHMPMRAQDSLFGHALWAADAPQWISQPGGDSCHDVWFSHSYYFDELPDEAYIEITTAGWAEIFVNGRNISNALLWPSVDSTAEAAVCTGFDIGRFMCQGVNRIAVDYAPKRSGCSGCEQCSASRFGLLMAADSCPGEPVDTLCHYKQSATQPKGQIALRFYGVYPDSTEFESRTDSTWQCHDGRRTLTDDQGELIDSRKAEYRMGRLSSSDIAGWTAAIITPIAPADTIIRTGVSASGLFLENIIEPTFGGSENGCLIYNFGKKGFVGLLRLTLRDCQRGQMIQAGKLRYICSGDIDEQAYSKFTPQPIPSVGISGSHDFSRSNIYMIEGVELK